MSKKNVLGRGLGALIEDHEDIRKPIGTFQNTSEIEISKIKANPYQPRTEFDKDALEELSVSIKQVGIIQPITLRKLDDDSYQLIAGERRLRAAQMAGMDKIPAFVRTANDNEMLEMALVENIQREDLNPIEVAMSYQRLMEECKLTQESLSERVGKKRSTVTNYVRLLKLPAEIQVGLREKKLSMGHARALVNIEDNELQLSIYQQIVEQDLSVRKVEELVREGNKQQDTVTEIKEEETVVSVPVNNSTEEYKELKEQLEQRFDAKVDFKRNDNGSGKIIISFRSDSELERIIGVLDKASV